MQNDLIRIAKKAAVAAAVVFFVAVQGTFAATDPDTPVASVNGEMITRQDLETEKSLYQAQVNLLGTVVQTNEKAPTPAILVEKMIDRKLLLQRAAEAEISVTSSMVNVRYNRLKKQASDTEAFQKILKDSGLTGSSFRVLIKEGLTIEYLLEHELFRHIFVSQDETKVYYQKHPKEFMQPEMVRVSQIMIRFSSSERQESESAIEKMDAVRKRIENGDNFSAVAVEYSEGPNRYMGGDLGYVSKKDLPPRIGEAAFSLKPGEISTVIETEAGIHMIKVSEKKPAQPLPFEAVRENIEMLLTAEKQEYAVKRYLKKLKKKAAIERYPLD